MKKSIVLTLSIVFLVLMVLGLKIFLKNKVPVQKISKHVKYGFTVQNKTNKLITDGNLYVYAPVKKNSFQSCVKLDANFPYKLVLNEPQNQILEFEITDLPPYATRIIQIEANLEYNETAGKTDLRKNYLLAETKIESSHPDIVGLAKKLKKTGPMETAGNIYRWVSSNIEYAGHIKENRGALYALQNKKGDCTEFMSLFIALCRADEIPARGIAGYTCTGDCILVPQDYHNWAEFYINGTWLLADCQKKVFNKNNSNYIAMQIIFDDKKSRPMNGFSRFRTKGNGLKAKMN